MLRLPRSIFPVVGRSMRRMPSALLPRKAHVVEYSSASESSSPPPKAKRSKAKWMLGTAVVGAGIYLYDLWVNDDIETLTDRFRTKLTEEERKDRPRVVILGGGWAALSMLRQLHADKFNVTIVSPRNYFLFTPLLPGTTTGTIELRSIMEPIRNYCSRSDAEEVQFIEAECINIDPATKTVKCADISGIKGSVNEFNLDYDHLVLAVGADVATFNVPGVKENAVFMKEAAHSRNIRDKIMDCFETASYPDQPTSEIERLLHFVVVGGGPSGVEYTAELNDFLLSDLSRAFPHLTQHVKITLIEALPHILSVFDAKLIDFVERKFKTSKNIEVWTKTAVTAVNEKDLVIKTPEGAVQNVPYGTLVWVTGNAPRPITQNLIKTLGPENQNCRRGVQTDGHFRVIGAKDIWALGDCTCTNNAPTAQVASQQGRYLGRLFNSLSDEMYREVKEKAAGENATKPGYDATSPFQYHHFGSFAYVGEHKAVAEFQRDPKATSAGLATWLLWRSVYLSKLLSVRNRIMVAFDWANTAIFGRDISRV